MKTFAKYILFDYNKLKMYILSIVNVKKCWKKLVNSNI